MFRLGHSASVVVYAITAMAIAASLPRAVPGIAPHLAYAAGAIIFLAAALSHEVLARLVERHRLMAALHNVNKACAQTSHRLAFAEHGINKLNLALETGEVANGNAEMIMEMRALGGMLEKLGGQPAQPTNARQAPVIRAGPSLVPAPSSPAREQTEIAEIMGRAISENRLDLYVQPVVSLPGRKVRFYETYTRIRDESGGLVMPSQYLPLACQQGLASSLDNLVVLRCVRLIRWMRRDKPDVGYFCNLSSASLSDEAFLPQLADFLEHNAELARSLTFEFPYAEAFAPELDTCLSRLTGLGFAFSVDHITSLDLDIPRLSERGFKFAKIGAEALVSGLELDVAEVAQLKAAMAGNDMHLIADKIESEQTLLNLLDCDVGYGQGYLFGTPRPSRVTAN